MSIRFWIADRHEILDVYSGEINILSLVFFSPNIVILPPQNIHIHRVLMLETVVKIDLME